MGPIKPVATVGSTVELGICHGNSVQESAADPMKTKTELMEQHNRKAFGEPRVLKASISGLFATRLITVASL